MYIYSAKEEGEKVSYGDAKTSVATQCQKDKNVVRAASMVSADDERTDLLWG